MIVINKITLEKITKDLTSYLQRAQAGETFLVFQGDRPVAKIISAKSEGVLDAFDTFRSRIISESIDLEPDEIFADVRDRPIPYRETF